MLVWIDAQLSPALAPWLLQELGVDAVPVRVLGLRDAENSEIFAAARAAGAIVMTKDGDFVTLVERHGPPPQIIWLTCGNSSNVYLRALLAETWQRVAALLAADEPLVEISARTD